MPPCMLLSPIRIGSVTLKNRVVMGPTETLYASAAGEVTQPILDYYEARARGGVGLIVLHSAQGNTDVDQIDPYAGSLRFDNDAYLPMLRELTERVHRYGARMAALVSIGGGAMANGDRYLGKPAGPEILVGPSAQPVGQRGRAVRELSEQELQDTIKAYGQCARRARQAGFDLFYIHALGGYLLAEFLSPLYNHRTDRYGGPLENRARLLLELIAECQNTAGSDFPLVVRFSLDERCPGGRPFEEGLALAQMLQRAGVAALDISVGYGEKRTLRMPSIYVDRRETDPYIKKVRDEVEIPIIHQGKLHHPEEAEQVLRDGVADLVMISRGLIAEPDWVNKVAKGHKAEIRHCLSCNYCLAGRIVKKLPLRCAINPEAGREGMVKREMVRAPASKRIAIVGGGPAGLQAAHTLARRGHQVDLYEAAGRLCGGQLALAQQPPGKETLQAIPNYYQEQFKTMSKIKLHLNTRLDAADLANLQADEIVLANGALPLLPRIPHIKECGALTAQQILNGTPAGRRVVIAGGGQIGAETAHFLSEQGHIVSILEAAGQIAAAEEPNTRAALLDILQEKGVKMYTGWRIEAFAPKAVTATHTVTGETKTFPCDTIVLAFGTSSDRSLYDACQALGKPVHLIGDAERTSNIQAAIESGFLLGLAL